MRLKGAQTETGLAAGEPRSANDVALEPAGAWLRALFEDAPMAIGFSRDGATMGANAAYVRLFGYDRVEELLGRSLLEQIAPSERPRIVEKIGRRARGEYVPSFYGTIGLRKDGTEFPFQIAVTRVIVPDGPLTIAFIRDMTEHQQAEQSLRDALELNRSLISASNLGILAYRADGQCVLANDAASALVGGKVEQVLALNFHQIESWKKSGLYDAALDVLRSGRPRHEEIHIVTSFGCERRFEFHLASFTATGQNHLLLTLRDMSEQRRVETALRENEERLSLALEASEEGFWDLDRTTGQVHLSPRFQLILGYEPGEMSDRYEELGAHVHPDDLSGPLKNLAAECQSKLQDRLDLEFRMLDKRGDVRWVRVRGKVTSRDAHGAPARIVGTLGDVTERRRAEEARRRLEERIGHVQKLESLGVLAGGVAHDFNNLLMAIFGNVDLALRETPPDSVAVEYLEAIAAASRRAAELCRQMLAYSGRGRFRVELVDLGALVREMAQMLEVSVSKKAKLELRPSTQPPIVRADATQLRQVVMNLIINASEALPGGFGTITVSTGVVACDRAYLSSTAIDDDLPPGSYAYVEVADTGSGMDAATVSRMFDPFFTTKFTGRGLGMAAVLGIVRGHLGAIRVESVLGRGTVVRVLFPLCDGSPREEVALPVERERWARGSVLVVDDEEPVRLVTRRMLEVMGFQVLEACDGVAALEIFRAHRGSVACVLLDLTMPRMDGEETLAELRRIDPCVRVIVSSGYGEQQLSDQFAGRGVAAVVAKPYRYDALEAALRACVAL